MTREEIKYKQAESPARPEEAFITRFPGNSGGSFSFMVEL